MNKEWKEYKFEDILKVSSGKGLVESDFILGFYKVYGGNGIIGYHSFYTNIKSELIIGRVGAHCGNIHITRPNSWITDNALILKFLIANQNIMFWFYLLKFKKLRDIAFQSAQPVVTAGTLKNITLNLPPLPQQKKIANILSTCDRVIEKTEQAIAKYQALKQGMMQDLFARGIDLKTGKLRPSYLLAPHLYKKSPLGFIPLEWEVETVDDVALLRHGYQFRDFDFTEEGLDIVKIGQVGKNGFLNLNKASKIDINRLIEFEKIQLFNDDILMALTGATLGKTAIVKNIEKPILQNYRVGYFTPKNENQLNKMFLYFLLIGESVQNEILGFVNAGAQGNIGKSDFEKILITLPNTIKEQTQIAQKLESIDQKIALEQEVLVKYQQLKAGLMQDLLTAKVLVSV